MPRLGHQIVPRIWQEPPAIPGCRWIPLTKGQFALVDESDYQELSRFSWAFLQHGYAFRKAPKGYPYAHIRMHRQILGLTDPKIIADHRNGDGLDNRRSNIRIVTATGNARNNRGNRNRLGPYKGVHPTGRPGKPWAAKITVERRTVNLGRFKTAEEAAKAYDAAAVTYFGEHARLNFGQITQEDEFLELISSRGELRASDELFE